MKRLYVLMICCALPMLAAEPFTGTWKEDITTRNVSGAPLKLEISNGVFKNLSSNPPISLKADGTDQPVSGASVDMVNVRIVDDHTVEYTTRKAGKIVSQNKRTVSSDGTTFTAEITSYPPSGGPPVTVTNIRKRVGAPTPGMHLLSGTWEVGRRESVSDNGLLVTFEQTADGLKMTNPTGIHYDAKFDGREYPVSGALQADAKVVLKRTAGNIIEETDKNGDKVLVVSLYTLSADGLTIREEDRTPSTGRTVTYVLRKQ